MRGRDRNALNRNRYGTQTLIAELSRVQMVVLVMRRPHGMDRMAETMGVGNYRARRVSSYSSSRTNTARVSSNGDSVRDRWRLGDEATAGGGDRIGNSLRERRWLLRVVRSWPDGLGSCVEVLVMVGMKVRVWVGDRRHIRSRWLRICDCG